MVEHYSTQKIISELANSEVISKFSEDEKNSLKNEIKELKFSKGQEIIHENMYPTGVYCINSGTAKLYKKGFNGKEQILRFTGKGEIIGYRSLLCGESFGATSTALEDMVVTFIPENIFFKLLELSPLVSFDILKKISSDLGDAGKTITFLAQKTVRERLAEILLLLEDKLGIDDEGYINISLTREEMANLIGTATESAIRLISEFKADEFIAVDGRRIKILNHQKLTKLGHVTM